MKRRFTAQVPKSILKELGWSNPATYAEVFDHLADKGALISVSKFYSMAKEAYGEGYDWVIDLENTTHGGASGDGDTWEQAARYAILAAISLLNL